MGLVLDVTNTSPLASPLSVFRENVEGAERAAKEGGVWPLAQKLANQMFYGRASEAGSFYGYSGLGYGGAAEGSYPFINWKSSTQPIWIVPASQARAKVWLVEEESSGPEETLRNTTANPNKLIQEAMNAVPLPTLALIPDGELGAAGSDGNAIVICRGTDERWEFHRLGVFKEGPHKGEFKCGYSYYQAEASKWNGICATESGRLSASGLSLADGTLSLSDLVRVMRGGKIGHALAIAMYVVSAPQGTNHLAPAIGNDHAANTHEFEADGITLNPAFGTLDAIPEGGRYAFNPASHPSEYGIGNTLAVAIYEAIKEYGVIHTDKAGGPGFSLGDLSALYTPYCDTTVDPITSWAPKFAEFARLGKAGETVVPEAIWKGWQDPTLPTSLGLELNGVGGVLWNFPWRELEQIAPS